MGRTPAGVFLHSPVLEGMGLNHPTLENAITQTYSLLDKIDETLLNAGVDQMSQTVELANLSSMIGNIFGAAIAQHSNGLFKRNGPHKYPDLLCKNDAYPDIEIKMALENNKPKGHLAKAGNYITCRYVLCDTEGHYTHGKDNRGVTPFIWEMRCGHLLEDHFNLSNTAGDSGKTAVVNADGMHALKVVYVDIDRAAVSKRGRTFAQYVELIESGG